MKTETREFLLTEYAHLRSEVVDAVKEVPANEKWALLTSGAFWGWLASLCNRADLVSVVWWVPAALTVLFFLRWRALENKFEAFGKYLLRVEKGLELDGYGWEHHINASVKNRFRINARVKNWFRIYGWGFWCLLFAGNIFLALWHRCNAV